MDFDRIDREGAEALSKDGECLTRMNMKDGEITVDMTASMGKKTFLEQYMDDHGHEVFADLTDHVHEIGEHFRQEEYRMQMEALVGKPLIASELRSIREVARWSNPSRPVETHREKMARKKAERATRQPDVRYTPEQLAFEADHALQARFRAKRREINDRIARGEKVNLMEALKL